VDKAIVTELLLLLVATMFGLLVAVFGWLSNKLYEKLEQMNKGLRDIETSLINRLHEIDRRVTKAEIETTPQPKIVSIRK
jgi:predicted PurR-regulated permease PerM